MNPLKELEDDVDLDVDPFLAQGLNLTTRVLTAHAVVVFIVLLAFNWILNGHIGSSFHVKDSILRFLLLY